MKAQKNQFRSHIDNVTFMSTGYYFVVWLMLSQFSCKITYLDGESLEYQVMADDVTYEVRDKYLSIES